MPPKKVDKGQQKAAEKIKQKIVEDKTFGLKNKNKSKSVQKFIRSVQQQVSGGRAKTEEQIRAEQHAQKEAKKGLMQQQALLASLYKGTENIRKLNVDPNAKKTDPRSIRMEQQIDVYVDQREQKKPADETMDDWDMTKLEQVVKTKHGGQKATTDIVCKYFLDALEKRLYGWFWHCPNGESCLYKHCLPPGYVLTAKKKPEDVEDEETEPIEELIERERSALPSGGTPVTFETFQAWKLRKKEEKRIELEEAKKKAAKESGRSVMSGRDLFAYDPSLFVDDDGAAADDVYLDRSSDNESDRQSQNGDESVASDDHEANGDKEESDDSAEGVNKSKESSGGGHSDPKQTDMVVTASASGEPGNNIHIGSVNLFLEDDGDEIDPDELEDD